MAVLTVRGNEFPVSVPVIIIGGGACGSVAALAAREIGAQVIVLERDALARGNTALSSAQIPAAGTRLQKLAGVQDTWEVLERDLVAQCRGQCNLAVARRVSRESGATIDWLMESHRVELSCITDFLYPGFSVPHMHATPSRFGAELMDDLVRALSDARIDTVNSAHATDLFADEAGAIKGVAYSRPDGSRETAACDTLILACNGYGGNPELVRRYIPTLAGAHHHGHEGNDGSAVVWGEELGASLKDMASFQGHGALCTPHMIHLGWPAFSLGGFQVNSSGSRFSNEMGGVSAQALKVLDQHGGIAWAIWDMRCDDVAAQMHNHVDARKLGAIRSFENTRDLAYHIGIGQRAVDETIRAVESYCRGEAACPWGRDFTAHPPLQPPYQCAKVTGALFHTQGGLEIDADARVLRPDGSPFPNLFAGGGAARGLAGPADWGYLPGSGLLTALNLGRIAGTSAGRQVTEHKQR